MISQIPNHFAINNTLLHFLSLIFYKKYLFNMEYLVIHELYVSKLR